MTDVSVIIPTYNRAEQLKKAVLSVLNQTYQDFEIIVIDDESKDNTKEVIRDLNNPKIRYLRHDTNKGETESRNTGIRSSDSKYIAFLDDDDEWLPDKLEKQIKKIEEEQPEVGIVYTGFYRVDRESGRIIETEHPTKSGYLYYDLLYKNCITGGGSTVMLKRDCFDKVGLFDPDYQSYGDWDMWLRLSKEFQYAYVDEPLVKYNLHVGNVSKNYKACNQGEERIVEKNRADYEDNSLAYSFRFYRMGIRLSLMGETKKAKEYFMKAIELYPLVPRYYFCLVLSFFGQGMMKNAIRIRDMLTPWQENSDT